MIDSNPGNPAMSQNPTEDLPAADAAERPPSRKRSAATRFFLRGLAISLPPILTVVIVLWLAEGVNTYIIHPTSVGVEWAMAKVIDESRELEELKELDGAPSLQGCGTGYRVESDLLEEIELRQRNEGVSEIPAEWLYSEQHRVRVFVVINSDEAIPYDDYQFAVKNTTAGEMPRSAVGIYMVIARYRHFGGQLLLSAFAVSILVIVLYFLGQLVTNRLGAWGVRKFESALVGRVPLVSNVYSSVKQVTDFLFTERTIEYNRIVAIEYPRRGIWSLGFVTGDSMLEMTTAAGEPLVTILVPTSPMPVTGYTLNVPKTEIIDLNITIDQAFQFCISCGVLVPESQKVTPESLQQALTRRLSGETEQPVVTRPAESVAESEDDKEGTEGTPGSSDDPPGSESERSGGEPG
jgi:uncharacterized membrane protein